MPDQIVRRRCWLVPEVVQTSAMDCGPAVLKCLLAGYGIDVHYGRLREACQTSLDGTSVDTLESVANQLGLVAEQVMITPDQVLLPESKALPAILIVRLPDGATHFVLAWRRHGPLVQVMDPSLGRRWMTCRQLIDDMYLHRQRVPADAWREWAVTDEMIVPLRRRLRTLGLSSQSRAWIASATGDSDWKPIAALDAVTRLVGSLVQSGGISRGASAGRTVDSLLSRLHEFPDDTSIVPDRFWSVRPCSQRDSQSETSNDSLWLSGAVLVRVAGRSKELSKPAGHGDSNRASALENESETSSSISRELADLLIQREDNPMSKIWRLVRGAGAISLLSLLVFLILAAIGVVLEAILLRGILDLRRDLAITPQRLLAIAGIASFGVGLMLLEYQIGTGLYRLGRRLECALRIEFLSKIPRLHDRYFQSRPTSDMAERGQSLYRVRLVPRSVGHMLRVAATMLLTATAIAWVEPAAALTAFVAAGTAMLLPILFVPLLQGLDLRVRTHGGALMRFTFDALLGLAAVRAHVANRAVSIEHESLLVDWVRASEQLLRWRVMVDGLQAIIGISLATWLLMIHASGVSDATGILLLAYWALNIPALGDEMAQLVHQYPSYRNITLRLLEPLGAPEQESVEPSNTNTVSPHRNSMDDADQVPPFLVMDQVQVRAGGHVILDALDISVPEQSHLAVVGPSGAGKSSLVGLLLGWHRVSAGQVLVDGRPLDHATNLSDLRKRTVWVDPAVQLWNQSLLENLLYGNPDTSLEHVGEVVRDSDLYDVLQYLPDGLHTSLGESGGLLSGGEGQRVRFGRGLARIEPRLVILDEPFRGLERHRRRELLQKARERWKSATLICITHDVSETLEFPRVLVLDGGRLVEDGSPAELMSRSESLYKSLIAAEESVRNTLWGSDAWRRIRLRGGRVEEVGGNGST